MLWTDRFSNFQSSRLPHCWETNINVENLILKMSAWFELWLKWAYYLTDLDLSMDLFALFIIRAAAGEIELKRRLEFNLGVIVSESYSWFGSVSKEKANFGTGGCQGSLVTLIQITGFCLRGDGVMDEVVAYGRRRSGFDPNDLPNWFFSLLSGVGGCWDR